MKLLAVSNSYDFELHQFQSRVDSPENGITSERQLHYSWKCYRT